ncbi:MAG TPA: iron ABC transporter permease [Bacilli bacterium]|nr:iron ABC transporter permease [Bacilli bacterium]
MKNLSLGRIWNQTKTFFSKPASVILLFFSLFLTATVIYPLISLIIDSFTVQSISEAREIADIWDIVVKKGDLTWAQWPNLLFNPDREYSMNFFWQPLYKSMLMALLACAIAVLSGGLLAWLITRSNLPFKKYISIVFIFPYIMPSWSIAMFWENFFKNTAIASANYQMGILESWTGIQVPENFLYGLVPCAIVLGIHYAPFAYILIGGILRNMDANLEEAATILKASRFRTLRKITIPIVAPAIISTILLVFSSSISSFTVPAFLNPNNSFTAISVTMRGLLIIAGKKGQGYVVAVILLVFSVLILTLNNWFTRSRRSFTTITGKSGQVSKFKIGNKPWIKYFVGSLIVIMVSFTAVLPLVTFILESLQEVPGDIRSITLKYWFSSESFDVRITSQGQSAQGILHNFTIWKAFGRSVLVAAIVALIAGTFGILIGYAVSKNRRRRIANYVSSTAFLPYLIPALSFSAIFFSLSFKPGFQWLNVSSTNNEWSAIIICVIVASVKFLPFASRSGTNAMLQVSGEIEEAAIITGCPWWKRMTRVLFPIQKSSLISGYLLPFISCMRELTLFVLITSSFSLITNVLSYFDIYGLNQITNGINLLIVLFVIVVNFLVSKLTGASIDKGIGG